MIADSGSTKTDWRFIDRKGKIISFTTAGFNPFFWTSKEIYEEIRKNLPNTIPLQTSHFPLHTFFYGAGCSSPERNSVISDALHRIFPGSKVEIYHDLLGAARALFGKQQGIAAILGTGSNSCLFDGKKIKEAIPALGYVLGDEGSGTHLGKKLLAAYLYGELPLLIEKSFKNKFNLSKEKILNHVYAQPLPNRYLASYSRFIFEKRRNFWMKNLIETSFREFFIHHIMPYKNHRNVPVGFVGSIAYKFRSILENVSKEFGTGIVKVIENPIKELVSFHKYKM